MLRTLLRTCISQQYCFKVKYKFEKNVYINANTWCKEFKGEIYGTTAT